MGNNDSTSITHRKQDPSKIKDSEKKVARLASEKLEDGDIKGAIRILCSVDSVADFDKETHNKLVDLHPPVPTDRRELPLPDTGAPLCVDQNIVRAAISSFNNGSSVGPDGLRSQHLKDMLSTSGAGDSLLESVTDFINLMLAGRVPERVRPILFGGRLTALKKKDGGLRPIAIGYTWRRLAAKVCCKHVSERAAAFFLHASLVLAFREGRREQHTRQDVISIT